MMLLPVLSASASVFCTTRPVNIENVHTQMFLVVSCVRDCPTENLVIVVLTAAVLWSGSWSHQLEFSHLLCKRNHTHMVV